MSFKAGCNHIHLFKQGRVETECEGMKDMQNERATVVRGPMQGLEMFVQAVESRHGNRQTMTQGLEGMDSNKYVPLQIHRINTSERGLRQVYLNWIVRYLFESKLILVITLLFYILNHFIECSHLFYFDVGLIKNGCCIYTFRCLGLYKY